MGVGSKDGRTSLLIKRALEKLNLNQMTVGHKWIIIYHFMQNILYFITLLERKKIIWAIPLRIYTCVY